MTSRKGQPSNSQVQLHKLWVWQMQPMPSSSPKEYAGQDSSCQCGDPKQAIACSLGGFTTIVQVILQVQQARELRACCGKQPHLELAGVAVGHQQPAVLNPATRSQQQQLTPYSQLALVQLTGSACQAPPKPVQTLRQHTPQGTLCWQHTASMVVSNTVQC
jgi:hypothetical protein